MCIPTTYESVYIYIHIVEQITKGVHNVCSSVVVCLQNISQASRPLLQNEMYIYIKCELLFKTYGY